MQRETLTYEADGLTMRGELFYETQATPRAGVLVFPEAFGLSDHARSRAERLAGQGYVALACDLHGEAKLIDGPEPERKPVKPARTHWDMLLERRSVPELEELLDERLTLLRESRGEKPRKKKS